jgi:hypothetical protein
LAQTRNLEGQRKAAKNDSQRFFGMTRQTLRSPSLLSRQQIKGVRNRLNWLKNINGWKLGEGSSQNIGL